MMRSIYYPKNDHLRFNLDLATLARVYRAREGVLWVNLEQPTKEEIQTMLRDIFHFHPLTLEDCQSPLYHPPKLDNFDDYLFIIVHALQSDVAPGQLSAKLAPLQLNCFLGEHYLVTVSQAAPMPPIQAV